MLNIRAATLNDLPELAQFWQEKIVLQADSRYTTSTDRWVVSASAWLTKIALRHVDRRKRRSLCRLCSGLPTQPMPGLAGNAVGLITELAIDAHSYQGGVGRALVDAARPGTPNAASRRWRHGHHADRRQSRPSGARSAG